MSKATRGRILAGFLAIASLQLLAASRAESQGHRRVGHGRGGPVTTLATGRTYTTNFPLTENPISEDGNWINGGADGIDWGDAASAGGFAHGVHVTTQYADPTAILAGPWGPDQEAAGVVFGTNSLDPECSTEVELRLRSAIAPNWNRGYEVFWSLRTGRSYIQIARWNGALGDFTLLYNAGEVVSPVDGYTLRARMVGNRITYWIHDTDGNILFTDSVVDTDGADGGALFTDGAPGMGFYIGSNCLEMLQNEDHFGFTSFTATDELTVDATVEPSTEDPPRGHGKPPKPTRPPHKGAGDVVLLSPKVGEIVRA